MHILGKGKCEPFSEIVLTILMLQTIFFSVKFFFSTYVNCGGGGGAEWKITASI